MAEKKLGGWIVPNGKLLGGSDTNINEPRMEDEGGLAQISLDVRCADSLYNSICQTYGRNEESEAFFEAANGLILKQFKPENIKTKLDLCARFIEIKSSHHDAAFLRSVKKWGLVLSSAFIQNKESFFSVFLNSVKGIQTTEELRDYGRRMKALSFWLKLPEDAAPVRKRSLEHGSPLASWQTIQTHEHKIIHLLKECVHLSDEDLNLFQSICISSLGARERMRNGVSLNNRWEILNKLRSASPETKSSIQEALRFSNHSSTILRMISEGNSGRPIPMPVDPRHRPARADVHQASPAIVKAVDSFLSRVVQNPDALSFGDAFSVIEKRMTVIKRELDNDASRNSYAEGMDREGWIQTMDTTWLRISHALQESRDFNQRLPKIVLFLRDKDTNDPNQTPGETRYLDLYLTASFTSSMTAYGKGANIRDSCGKGMVERFSGEGLQGICDAVNEVSGLKETIMDEFITLSNLRNEDFLKSFKKMTALSLYSGVTLAQKRRILGEHIINEAVKLVCPDRSFIGNGHLSIDAFFAEFDELSNFKEYVEYALEEFDEEMFGIQEFEFQKVDDFDKLAKGIFMVMPEGCNSYRKRDEIIQKIWNCKEKWLKSHPSTNNWIFNELWQERMKIFHRELLQVMKKTQVAGSGRAIDLVTEKMTSPLQALEWLLYTSILKEKPSELYDFTHDHQENIEYILQKSLEPIILLFDNLPKSFDELFQWAATKEKEHIDRTWNYEETWENVHLKDILMEECTFVLGQNCYFARAIKSSLLSPRQALQMFIAITVMKGKIYIASHFFHKHKTVIEEAIQIGETLRKPTNTHRNQSISVRKHSKPQASNAHYISSTTVSSVLPQRQVSSSQVMTLTKDTARSIGAKCKEDPNFTASMKVDNSKLYSWQDVEHLLPQVTLEDGVDIVMTFPGGLNKPKTFIQSHSEAATGNIKAFVVNSRVKHEHRAQMERGVKELNQMLKKKKTVVQQNEKNYGNEKSSGGGNSGGNQETPYKDANNEESGNKEENGVKSLKSGNKGGNYTSSGSRHEFCENQEKLSKDSTNKDMGTKSFRSGNNDEIKAKSYQNENDEEGKSNLYGGMSDESNQAKDGIIEEKKTTSFESKENDKSKSKYFKGSNNDGSKSQSSEENETKSVEVTDGNNEEIQENYDKQRADIKQKMEKKEFVGDNIIKTFSLVMRRATDENKILDIQWNILKIEMLKNNCIWILQTHGNNIFVFDDSEKT